VPEFNAGLWTIDNDLGLLQEGSQLRLLRQKPVQDELRLNAEQVQQITQLADQRRDTYRMLNNLSPEKWRQKIEEVRALEKTLTELLRPEQQQRLQQLLLQQRGIAAFTDGVVAQTLKLTAEQVERIGAIQGEVRRVTRSAVFSRNDAGKDTRERILSLLNPEQRAKWKELTGEPFQGVLLQGGIVIGNGTGNITIHGMPMVPPVSRPAPIKKE
jgi:hypothetical protein